jgi:hypothetical protein
MATAPKFTYRNAVTIPRQPNVSIYVDVPPLINDRFLDDSRTLLEDYILRCFGHAMYLSGVPHDVNHWNNYMMFSEYEEALGTFVYEDMTLREMKSPENPSYKKLEANLKWIGNTLKCNVSVFVGHVNTCRDYIDSIYKKAIEELTMLSSLPTIYVIIACHGDTMAHVLNTDSKYDIFRQHKITFFGFEDLLHIHEGEIYSTKLFDTARSKAICDSEEMVSLFDSFSADLEAEGIKAELPIEPKLVLELYRINPNLKIFNCCRTKLGRLYSDFVKGLERRETTKYPKELLMKKMKAVIDLQRKETLRKDYTTITSADGINCAKENCAIPNLYEEEERLSQNYNQKGALHTLFRELKSFLIPSYTYLNAAISSPQEFEATVEQFFKRIQGLKGNEMSIFTYTPKKGGIISPILFDIFQIDYPFKTTKYPLFNTIRFILQKYGKFLDFSLQDPTSRESILHIISFYKHLEENEKYILFKTIYDLLKTDEEREQIFFLTDSEGNIPLVRTKSSLLYLFYLEKFGRKLPSVICNRDGKVGNLLHSVMDTYISPENTEEDIIRLNIIRGLLQVGVDPNQKRSEEVRNYSSYGRNTSTLYTIKPLELYTSLYLPPYNQSLFNVFLQYGMTNDDLYFTKQQKFYEELETLPTKQNSFKRVVNALKDFLNETENIYRQRGGGHYNNDYYNRYSNNSRNNYDPEQAIMSTLNTEEEKTMYRERNNLYIDYAYNWNLFLNNIDKFQSKPMQYIKETNQLYKSSLQQRRGIKKHGSKVRKTYKANKQRLNKTIRNKLNTVSFTMNGEKMIGDLVGKILELAKRKEFTKEEKVNYKKRPITISKSELQPREKYDRLKEIYEQMESILKTR